MNELNLDTFWRGLFPIFEGKFEAFYILLDIITIYAIAYSFIWFLRTLRGD